jgi:hypothetical protein
MTYDQQRAYDYQRALAAHRIGQIESAMNVLENYIEERSKQAAEAEWQRRWDIHRARAAATPAPAPPPADREPTYEEIKRAARLPRTIQVPSIIDPLCTSPGANIRMR